MRIAHLPVRIQNIPQPPFPILIRSKGLRSYRDLFDRSTLLAPRSDTLRRFFPPDLGVSYDM